MVSDPHPTPPACSHSQDSGPREEFRPPHFNWVMDRIVQIPPYVSTALPFALPPPPPNFVYNHPEYYPQPGYYPRPNGGYINERRLIGHSSQCNEIYVNGNQSYQHRSDLYLPHPPPSMHMAEGEMLPVENQRRFSFHPHQYPSWNLRPCYHSTCGYYQPDNQYHYPNHEYYPQRQHPASVQYQSHYQPPLVPLISGPIVPPMPLDRCMPEYIPASTYNEQSQPEMDDPEAKLFIGNLPVQMTTSELQHELNKTFEPFGKCKVNVVWKPKSQGKRNDKSLPTAWIQYETPEDAETVLTKFKEQGCVIGNRSVRVERADGKRICRIWPSRPSATVTMEEFRRAFDKFFKWTGITSGLYVPHHISCTIEKVKKNYGGQKRVVSSIGILFRWCEDAIHADAHFTRVVGDFRLNIEPAKITGVPIWRRRLHASKGFVYLEALSLEPGDKWRRNWSRRSLQEPREPIRTGTYPYHDPRVDEYSWDAVPCKVLECPNLKSEDPCVSLNWLDLDQNMKPAVNTEPN